MCNNEVSQGHVNTESCKKQPSVRASHGHGWETTVQMSVLAQVTGKTKEISAKILRLLSEMGKPL